MHKYFIRFDLDGCGKLSSRDDLRMLCTSLCVKLEIGESTHSQSANCTTGMQLSLLTAIELHFDCNVDCNLGENLNLTALHPHCTSPCCTSFRLVVSCRCFSRTHWRISRSDRRRQPVHATRIRILVLNRFQRSQL